MDSSSALPQHIADALADGTTVLTANQRAARTLQHDYNLQQRDLGRAFWEPPAILAWDAWLTSLWHRLIMQGDASDILLSDMQELTIWRAVIAADAANAVLQSIDALARTAAEAWNLLHEYRGRPRLSAYAGNSDNRAFANWVKAFDRRCERFGYLTRAQLPEALRAAVLAGRLVLPSRILLVGFDAKAPAQIALLDAIRATGASVTEPAPAPAAGSLTLAAAADSYAEVDACANWIRSYLTAHPRSRVAVIVPAIDSHRAEIDRRFRRVLAPELENIATNSSAAPYEFSLGVPLGKTSLVSTALEILRWAVGPLSVERISALLLSPYFAASTGAEDELLTRSEFDAFVVRQQHLLQPAMSADQLLRLASGERFTARLPILVGQLRLLSSLGGNKNFAGIARTCTHWAETFHQLLDAAGFALPARLDSVQFQTRRKWEEILDELTTLDFDSEAAPLDFAAALDALTRIADDTRFAPESKHAQVQILGPLESAGSTFDATWFLNASDLAWPSVSSPNPLLPWQMQRELKMPGANPAHDAEVARQITERIAGSASTVIFSYACESSEGRQRPSFCLTGIASLERTDAAKLASPPTPRTRVALDTFVDDAVIPFPPDRVLRGGASILQAQAACEFRAFAEMRLSASTLDSPSLGLDAAERGSLVHAVLDDFWGVVETQAVLKQMTYNERESQIHRSIDAALQRHHSHPADGWPRAYLDAERQRLTSLVAQFLDYEATQRRRPFTVRAREEKLSDVSIGSLRLDVRVDRIDTVELEAADGTRYEADVILDYKTGKTSPADWHDQRPDAPQLPLYAVVSDSSRLAAVAFATLRPGKDMGIRGYESPAGILPKASRIPAPTLADQVIEWRGVLEGLADDFYQGHANVSPKSYPKTCTHCAQRLLCRLDLSTLTSDGLDDEDNSELTAEADHG